MFSQNFDLQFRSSEEDVIYYKDWRAEIMLEFSLTVCNILLLLYVSWCTPSILSWAAPHLSIRCQTPDLPSFNLHSFSAVKVLFIHRKLIQNRSAIKLRLLGWEQRVARWITSKGITCCCLCFQTRKKIWQF